MKAFHLSVLTIHLLAANAAFAQGSLTPPGAPAATMKTLAQIEARTPISSAPFTISIPGSYYLTTNLSVTSGTAITISASGVTLDLNGFTISSTEATPAGSGILLPGGVKNITIANGFIRGSVTNTGGTYSGSGFGYGIWNSGSAQVNVLVSRVSISGCRFHGINLALESSVVESCSVRTVGSLGIVASIIKSCSASDCGAGAIVGEQVSDCRGGSSASAFGVTATAAHNCHGTSSSGTGLSAITAENCHGFSGSGTGLDATSAANNCNGFSAGAGAGISAGNASNCRGQSSSGTGVLAKVATNCYGRSSSGVGLYAETAHNCQGISDTSTGLDCVVTATGSYGATSAAAAVGLKVLGTANVCGGKNTAGGTAIQAAIGIGCTTYGGSTSIPDKFLGTP